MEDFQRGGIAFPRISDEIQVTGYMLATELPFELFYKCDNAMTLHSL